MSAWNLLDEKEEAELHKSRLLNVEEKPFKRVTKRLVALTNLAAATARQAPTPPPESHDATDAATTQPPPTPAERLRDTKEDVILDFAAFDGSITRLQSLLSANERERARYAADRVRILETSQSVRDSTAELRLRLARARETLEQRRKFDDLAEKITSNRMLRPRGDQKANLRKLEEECAQLEAESETYADTWRERRDQFSRIMEESMRLRRLIRDEKEEVERREGMDDEGGQGDAEADSVQTPRPGLASGNATPRPDNGTIHVKVGGLESGDGSGTPRHASTVGGRTPARESPGPTGLKPPPEPIGGFSRSGSRAPSRTSSPQRSQTKEPEEPEEGEDVEMDDDDDDKASVASSPLSAVATEDSLTIVVGGMAGMADPEDKMDTT